MTDLDEHYRNSHHDALVPRDLLFDEVKQRRETGYDVEGVVRQANRVDPYDATAVLSLVDQLAHAERTNEWSYVEPEGLDAIRASLPELPAAREPDSSDLQDAISAAWLGRIAGCNIGKPVEWGTHWTSDHIRDYLERADAYPLRDYFPLLDPMPAGFELRDNWPETTRGRVDGSARDDDIDYPILALHLLETHGAALRPELVVTLGSRSSP